MNSFWYVILLVQIGFALAVFENCESVSDTDCQVDWICPDQEQPKSCCKCTENYLFNPESGNCVLLENCPKNKTATNKKKCNETNNEVFSFCANCASTCQTIVNHVEKAKPGCICKTGYIMDERTGICILLKDSKKGCNYTKWDILIQSESTVRTTTSKTESVGTTVHLLLTKSTNINGTTINSTQKPANNSRQSPENSTDSAAISTIETSSTTVGFTESSDISEDSNTTSDSSTKLENPTAAVNATNNSTESSTQSTNWNNTTNAMNATNSAESTEGTTMKFTDLDKSPETSTDSTVNATKLKESTNNGTTPVNSTTTTDKSIKSTSIDNSTESANATKSDNSTETSAKNFTETNTSIDNSTESADASKKSTHFTPGATKSDNSTGISTNSSTDSTTLENSSEITSTDNSMKSTFTDSSTESTNATKSDNSTETSAKNFTKTNTGNSIKSTFMDGSTKSTLKEAINSTNTLKSSINNSTESTSTGNSTDTTSEDDASESTSADDSTESTSADDSTESTSSDESTESTSADDSTDSTSSGDSAESTVTTSAVGSKKSSPAYDSIKSTSSESAPTNNSKKSVSASKESTETNEGSSTESSADDNSTDVAEASTESIIKNSYSTTTVLNSIESQTANQKDSTEATQIMTPKVQDKQTTTTVINEIKKKQNNQGSKKTTGDDNTGRDINDSSPSNLDKTKAFLSNEKQENAEPTFTLEKAKDFLLKFLPQFQKSMKDQDVPFYGNLDKALVSSKEELNNKPFNQGSPFVSKEQAENHALNFESVKDFLKYSPKLKETVEPQSTTKTPATEVNNFGNNKIQSEEEERSYITKDTSNSQPVSLQDLIESGTSSSIGDISEKPESTGQTFKDAPTETTNSYRNDNFDKTHSSQSFSSTSSMDSLTHQELSLIVSNDKSSTELSDNTSYSTNLDEPNKESTSSYSTNGNDPNKETISTKAKDSSSTENYITRPRNHFVKFIEPSSISSKEATKGLKDTIDIETWPPFKKPTVAGDKAGEDSSTATHINHFDRFNYERPSSIEVLKVNYTTEGSVISSTINDNSVTPLVTELSTEKDSTFRNYPDRYKENISSTTSTAKLDDDQSRSPSSTVKLEDNQNTSETQSGNLKESTTTLKTDIQSENISSTTSTAKLDDDQSRSPSSTVKLEDNQSTSETQSGNLKESTPTLKTDTQSGNLNETPIRKTDFDILKHESTVHILMESTTDSKTIKEENQSTTNKAEVTESRDHFNQVDDDSLAYMPVQPNYQEQYYEGDNIPEEYLEDDPNYEIPDYKESESEQTEANAYLTTEIIDLENIANNDLPEDAPTFIESQTAEIININYSPSEANTDNTASPNLLGSTEITASLNFNSPQAENKPLEIVNLSTEAIGSTTGGTVNESSTKNGLSESETTIQPKTVDTTKGLFNFTEMLETLKSSFKSLAEIQQTTQSPNYESSTHSQSSTTEIRNEANGDSIAPIENEISSSDLAVSSERPGRYTTNDSTDKTPTIALDVAESTTQKINETTAEISPESILEDTTAMVDGSTFTQINETPNQSTESQINEKPKQSTESQEESSSQSDENKHDSKLTESRLEESHENSTEPGNAEISTTESSSSTDIRNITNKFETTSEISPKSILEDSTAKVDGSTFTQINEKPNQSTESQINEKPNQSTESQEESSSQSDDNKHDSKSESRLEESHENSTEPGIAEISTTESSSSTDIRNITNKFETTSEISPKSILEDTTAMVDGSTFTQINEKPNQSTESQINEKPNQSTESQGESSSQSDDNKHDSKSTESRLEESHENSTEQRIAEISTTESGSSTVIRNITNKFRPTFHNPRFNYHYRRRINGSTRRHRPFRKLYNTTYRRYTNLNRSIKSEPKEATIPVEIVTEQIKIVRQASITPVSDYTPSENLAAQKTSQEVQSTSTNTDNTVDGQPKNLSRRKRFLLFFGDRPAPSYQDSPKELTGTGIVVNVNGDDECVNC